MSQFNEYGQGASADEIPGVNVNGDGAAGEPALLGRQAECEVLGRLAANARAGRGGALVVRGGPGAGKTALLDYLGRRASEFLVVRVAGIESEQDCAFAALHRLCGLLWDRQDRLAGPQRDALATAFGELAADSPDHFLVGLAVLNLLSTAATDQPVLCVVDDAQWLDAASMRAIAIAARRLAAGPVALIVGSRQADAGQDFAGVADLALPALAEEDARALLDSRLTGPVDSGVRDQMLAEARGNPLRLLQAATRQTPEELAGGFGLPAGVTAPDQEDEAVRRELDTLPATTRLLLLIAAAEPAGNPVLVLRAARRLGADLEPETAAGIIEFTGRVQFLHHRARSAVYWAASPADRQRVHRALAASTDPHADPHRLAWHLAHASAALDEDVASVIEEVAGSAGNRGGLAASAMFYEHAAMRTPDAARRASRALAAARAKHRGGAPGSALRLLAVAQAGPLDDLGRRHAGLLRAQLSPAGPGAAQRLVAAAARLESLDPVTAHEGYGDALDRARSAGRLAGQDDLREVAAAVRAAQATAGRQSHDEDDLASGLAVLITDGFAAGGPALRRALGVLSDQTESGAPGCGRLLLGCRVAGDLWDHATWRRLSGQLIAEAHRTGELHVLPAALHNGALAELLAGETTAAAAMARQADAVAQATEITAAPYASLALAAWTGAEAAVERLITTVTPRLLARREGRWLTAAAWATAVLSNGLGRYEEALAAAEEGAAGAVGLGLTAWSMAELIEAAARLGCPERARGALGRLRGIAAASESDWARGLLARSQALITEDEAAEQHYRTAISLLDRAGVAAELARARLLYGEWLRRRMRRLDAREQLREAHQMLTAMGAAGFAARARGELMATGETARRRVPETASALTAQEVQIARLAADGLTNPEIGVKLFLSARTVEWHLRKVYVKLGVSSRRRLREALPRTPQLLALAAR
jgi:DNA-binding CsgD family transcriptional regulator